MFFLLEQKEPKIQECRIAFGRIAARRALVATLQMALRCDDLTIGLPLYHAELDSGSTVKSNHSVSWDAETISA